MGNPATTTIKTRSSISMPCALAEEWALLGNPLRRVHLRGLVVWTVLVAGLVLSLLWSVFTDFELAWTIGACAYLGLVTVHAAVTVRPGCGAGRPY